MNIEILPTAQAARNYDFQGKTAVVIDVFRATSVITTALNAGASAVIPVATVDEAFSRADSLGRSEVLLCGERNADPIPGFDMGNSPQLYVPERVARKTIILTTTNGTLAIDAARSADKVLVASMLNYRHVAALLVTDAVADVVIVCSGTDGVPALEDSLCAAMLCATLQRVSSPNIVSDYATSVSLLAQLDGFPYRLFPLSRHYQTLVDKGYKDDVLFCANPDADFNLVPHLSPDGRLRP